MISEVNIFSYLMIYLIIGQMYSILTVNVDFNFIFYTMQQ